MKPKMIFWTVLAVVLAGIIAGAVYFQTQKGMEDPSGPEKLADTTSQNEPTHAASQGAESKSNPSPDLTVDTNGLSKANIVMTTTQGVVKFKLYSKDAPITTNRIVQLVQDGFYNGLTFHRVVPGFVIQGGDPQGTGTGGSGQKLKAEFNDRHHVEGTVAMARAADPDSADSQFYITLAPQPHLDRSYTVFGQVIEGMDTVKKIQRGDKINSMIVE